MIQKKVVWVDQKKDKGTGGKEDRWYKEGCLSWPKPLGHPAPSSPITPCGWLSLIFQHNCSQRHHLGHPRHHRPHHHSQLNHLRQHHHVPPSPPIIITKVARRREDWSLSNSDPKCLHPPSWSCWATLTHLKQISKLKAQNFWHNLKTERKLTTSNLRLEKKSSWRWNQALSAVVILTGRSLLRRLFAFETLANFSSLYNSLPFYTLYNSLLFYILYNSLPFTKCNIQYYRMSKSSLCIFLFEIHPWNTGNGGLANFGTVKFWAPFHCKFFLC